MVYHNTESRGQSASAVPGHEFSGIITAIGKDVQEFEIGDEVYGMNDWFADFISSRHHARLVSWWMHWWARKSEPLRLRRYRIPIELLGVAVIAITAHLGGFLSGVTN